MEKKTEDAVTKTTDDVVLEEETTDVDDVEALKQQLAEAEEAKRQLTARAKTAEAKLKEKPQEKEIINPSLSAEDVDIKILQSQGKSEESIAYLKKLAQVNGTSILAAQSDELYLAYEEKREAKIKADKASLGATRGSGQTQKSKGVTTPDLSEAEHKALWRQQMGM